MLKTRFTQKNLKLFASYSSNVLLVLFMLKYSFDSFKVFGDKDCESKLSSGFSFSLTLSISSLSHLILDCNSKSLCKILSLKYKPLSRTKFLGTSFLSPPKLLYSSMKLLQKFSLLKNLLLQK